MSSTEIVAQLNVRYAGNVGVGANAHANYRMYLLNSREYNALRITSNQYTSATRIGLYNLTVSKGTGARFGIFNELRDDFANANSSATSYGIYNKMSITNRSRSIGFTNSILNKNNNGNEAIYGFYSVVNVNSTGNAKMYGVYSDIQGDNNYAGYFTGKMHINGDFTLTSDASLKTNTADVTDAIAILRDLKPQTYKFKKGNRFGYNPDQMYYGFMAQEVESVLPSIVSDINHPTVYLEDEKGTQLDEEGSVIEQEEKSEEELAPTKKYEAETLKAIRYLDLIAILTQAVKDQQEIIEDQTFNYEALESEVDELRAEMKEYRDVLSKLANCAGCADTGSKPIIEEEKPTDIQFFPNPANEVFTIQSANDTGFGARLFSADGKLVQEIPYDIGSKRINTSVLPAGNYIVEVFDAANKTLEKQIVVVVVH
ncbi:tail fiber domain-containing protein [Neolewinella agarilytica]|nr:tail fiber domain-containing protein [Neolewinella agarilytica]